jgi:hypothetical protein
MIVLMNELRSDWITVAEYENLPGCVQPMAAARA